MPQWVAETHANQEQSKSIPERSEGPNRAES